MKTLNNVFEGMFDVDDNLNKIADDLKYGLDWIKDKHIKDTIIRCSDLNQELPKFTNQKREISALPKLEEIKRLLDEIPGIDNKMSEIDRYILQCKQIMATFNLINNFFPVIHYIDKNSKNLPKIHSGYIGSDFMIKFDGDHVEELTPQFENLMPGWEFSIYLSNQKRTVIEYWK